MILLLSLASFLCGSMMFSYWLGALLQRNIRKVGDGNPGAANLWKAVGYKYGLIGVFLDFSKGYVPIYLIMKLGLATGYEWIPIALAPICGHAFSPFLLFKGGKAIAVTFGVWSALTYFEASLAYAIILAILQIIAKVKMRGKSLSTEADSFQTILGMLFLSVYLYVRDYPAEIIWIWLGNLLLLLYTNRYHLVNFVKE